MTLDAFIRALPKTETHLHLEGALPYERLHMWRPEAFPASPDFLEPGYVFPDFPAFERRLFGLAGAWLTSAERYHEAARAVFARHVEQNVRYVELSFHLPMSLHLGVPAREILAAIRSAAPAGLELRVFAGMSRSDYAGPLRAVIDDLANWDELAGVDLHGNEAMPTQAWTAPLWARLRAAGKVTKCHAGEFDGAARVREAIEELGVSRVQHGVRAIEDPAVVALARELGVVFDLCPISNVRLGVVRSAAAHPLRSLLSAGVVCTISTDDPLVFGNTIEDEYRLLARDLGFTRGELVAVARNGWRAPEQSPAGLAEAEAELAWLHVTEP